MLGLSSPQLADVELEFLSLEDVTIGASRLSRARRDGSVKTTSRELRLEERVEFAFLLTFGNRPLDVSRLLVGILSDSSESLLGLLGSSRMGEWREESVRGRGREDRMRR